MNNEIIDSKSRSEWEALINEWVHNEKHRNILKRRLLDGICYEPLAEEFDMSVTHVRAIIAKCSKQLFKHI